MTDRLPLLSAQLAFGLEAQRTGRRPTVTLMFRTPPARLSAAEVGLVLRSLVLRNPALSFRIRFSRGAAYQEWSPDEPDFAERHAASEEAASNCVAEAIEEFETSLDGASMAARLIRCPDMDNLLLIFDHALVDEQSLLLVKRQLAAPSPPDDRRMERYQAAVLDRMEAEDTAVNGPGMEFWTDRLECGGDVSRPAGKATRIIPVTTLGGVALPRSVRRSLFPYVLYSIHRALRDLGEPGPTVIGYPWGGARNPAYSDVAGCFMNTVVSLDTDGSRQTLNEFLGSWYSEIDHADVPLAAITARASKFTGAVTAQLSYTHAAERSISVAGVPALEVRSSHGRTPHMAALVAGVVVGDDDLRLRLLLDEDVAGFGSREFGTRWRHWLDTAIKNVPERKSVKT